MAFDDFAQVTARRLRAALTAAHGPEIGADSAAEAMAYAWEHWDQIQWMDNPAGYLYRVGQTAARRLRRTGPLFPVVPPELEVHVEPGLPAALGALTEMQRTCVVLIHGYGFGQTEVADLLDVSPSTVRTHLDRGLTALRTSLAVTEATHDH